MCPEAHLTRSKVSRKFNGDWLIVVFCKGQAKSACRERRRALSGMLLKSQWWRNIQAVFRLRAPWQESQSSGSVFLKWWRPRPAVATSVSQIRHFQSAQFDQGKKQKDNLKL